MGILKNSKSLLDYIGKDATLLSITIIILYLENVYYFSYEKSLISENSTEIDKLIQFRFIAGFIIFMFTCKFLFILYWHLTRMLLGKLFSFDKIDFPVSYKIGLGTFAIAGLLFFHLFVADESNLFLKTISCVVYKAVCIALILIALFFSTICNWSGNEKRNS